MKIDTVYDYVTQTDEVNPNVVKSMLELLKEQGCDTIPLEATKNGVYDRPEAIERRWLNKKKYDINSKEVVPYTYLGAPANTYAFVIPCEVPDNIDSKEGLIAFFKKEEIEIKAYNFFIGSSRVLTINADTIPQLIEEGLISGQRGVPIVRIASNEQTNGIISFLGLPLSVVMPSMNPITAKGTGMFITFDSAIDTSYEVTCWMTEITQPDGFYPVTVNVSPDVEPISITKNGQYNGLMKRDITHIIDSAKIPEDELITFESDGATVYAFPILEGPKEATIQSAKEYFVKHNISFFIEMANMTITADNMEELAEVKLGAISVSALTLCPNSMAQILPGLPDHPGMFIITNMQGIAFNTTTTYTSNDEVQIDGYLPVTVNVPQGFPISVATEPEMDTLSTEHKAENVGKYYTYTGTTGKYTQNKDYKMTASGFVL